MPKYMVVAMTDVRLINGKTSKVALGVRLCEDGEVTKMQKALVNQIRTRYPELVQGMKPKEIEKACQFHVYKADEASKHGFPQWLGEAHWYA